MIMNKKLLFHCDNQTVVDISARRSFRDPLLMHLVRSTFFSVASNQFSVLDTHIRGVDNSISGAGFLDIMNYNDVLFIDLSIE